MGVTVLCPTFFRTNIVRSGHVHGDEAISANAERVTEKLMDRAKLQAPGVARVALEAADRGDLYALPHADGRWAWRLKRLMPRTFQGVIAPRLIQAARKRM